MNLEMADDEGGEITEVEIQSKDEILDECRDLAHSLDNDPRGARVCISWDLFDDDGEPLGHGREIIDVDADHDALIEEAGGDTSCQHQWSAEGEGGCDDNPGVWSTGGTGIVYREHCTKCWLHKTEYHTGSQYNYGEADTVEYEQGEPPEATTDVEEEVAP